MRKSLNGLLILLLSLVACQKEESLEVPGSSPDSGGNTGGQKLVRMGVREGADTITVNYAYNAMGKLTEAEYIGIVTGVPFEFRFRFHRDANNIITSTVEKSPLYPLFGFDTDSIVRVHTYDASLGRYIRTVSRFVLDDIPQGDSTVYAYDVDKKMILRTTYYRMSGQPYEVDAKGEATYNGNVLASLKDYTFDGTDFNLDIAETYEYDDKINPQHNPIEAVLLGMKEFYPANNITKNTKQVTEPPSTQVVNFSFTYNNANLPVKSVATSGGGASGTTSYFYQ